MSLKRALNSCTSWCILYPWFVLIISIFNAFDHTSCFPQSWFMSEIWNSKGFLLVANLQQVQGFMCFLRGLAPDREAGMETPGLRSSGFCLSAGTSPLRNYSLCWIFGSPRSFCAIGNRRDRGLIDAVSRRERLSTCRYGRVWFRSPVMPKTFLRTCLTLLKDLGWELATN